MSKEVQQVWDFPEFQDLERIVMYAPTNSDAGRKARAYFVHLNAVRMAAIQEILGQEEK